jgi:hypothetical protein
MIEIRNTASIGVIHHEEKHLGVSVFKSRYFNTVTFVIRELFINYTQALELDENNLGLTLRLCL